MNILYSAKPIFRMLLQKNLQVFRLLELRKQCFIVFIYSFYSYSVYHSISTRVILQFNNNSIASQLFRDTANNFHYAIHAWHYIDGTNSQTNTQTLPNILIESLPLLSHLFEFHFHDICLRFITCLLGFVLIFFTIIILPL